MKCIFLYSNEEHNIFCFQQDVPLPEENPPEVRMDISDECSEENRVDTDSSACSREKEERFSEVITEVNRGLSFIASSPIEVKKIHQKKYCREKMRNISVALKKNVFGIDTSSQSSDEDDYDDDDGQCVLNALKKRFNNTTDRTVKIPILTVVYEWSYQKILQHFPDATRHMIDVAKKTAIEKDILSGPNPKSHPGLSEDVVNLVSAFYNSDKYSRVMPGQKDFVSVKIDGKRNHMQKRLILNNLKELHRAFKDTNPDVKCSFSKFASLRPKYCILAGASGTHSVCVCAIHENVKLLLEGASIKSLTANTEHVIGDYHDCFKKMICDSPSTNCYMKTCSECPGVQNLIEYLESVFEDNFIDSVTYKQWTHVDRTTLQTVVSPADEYLQLLSEELTKLLRHSFIVKKQNEFLNAKKENLKVNEGIVICDFAENYAFIVQNSVQGIHWNNNQATIHPFAIYYKDDKNVLQMINLVSISECLHHDTVAVHMFQSGLVKFIREKIPSVNHIIYFSDGASAQYKNKKNFINLANHSKDFKITAEWHFFPTSHGKGPCDGLGGTLKRLAARASLQKIQSPIQTPLELYYWAIEALPNFNCNYFKNKEYEKEEQKLAKRFESAKTVKGTLTFHSIIPVTSSTLHAKPFSLFDKPSIVKVMK